MHVRKMPLCTKGIKEVAPLRQKRETQNGFLEWPGGEYLFELSIPFIFQL